ncbi:MAG: EamA family transporter, partial [Silanimonas sp.]
VSRLAALSAEALVTQVIVQGVLSGIVAVLCFTRAAELIGAGRAAVFPAMVPAAAIVLGIPLAGEWPNGWQLGGLALVSAGLLIAIGVLPAMWRKRP